MKLKDYLLTCLSEESGEITQAACKSLRFGLLDSRPGSDTTNWVDLRNEVHDLVAVYEMLCYEFDRVETLDRGLIDAKKVKVERYMAVSERLGRLIP